jgi:NIPSNAP
MRRRRRHLIAALGAGLALALTAPAATRAEPGARTRVVEIRSFHLKPGGRADFNRLSNIAAPMQRRRGIDVVAHGPSSHDSTSYYLIRAYASLADREKLEGAFYGSEEWKQGLRDEVMALIENYNTIVIDLDSATVERLRRP